MTEVAFHFRVPDKLAYACRLTRKAVQREARLVISAPQAVLPRIDRMLWAMKPTDFVAHCTHAASQAMQNASPVLLVPEGPDLPQWRKHSDMLLHLGDAVPEGYTAFTKMIEVVSHTDAEGQRRARGRWRHYVAQGDSVVGHDLMHIHKG